MEPFNENKLREEIVNAWGEHGVHIEVFDRLLKKKDLLVRNEKIELLDSYSMYLEKQGYLDADWRSEPPFAIDEFLKSAG